MREKRIIFKKSAGCKGRMFSSLDGHSENDGEVYFLGNNQFFNYYSDGSKEVRNIGIDYSDYTSDTYENIKVNISENIARLRKEQQLSYEDIANDVYVSRQYIAQIEKGERNVSIEILSRIASVLGVSIEFLIKKNPFKPCNIYIDKLVAELKELDLKRQKEICASIIENIWLEFEKNEDIINEIP